MFCFLRRNSAEMELTQARLDMMNLDGQLLEAINQKLELSQELDQWQVGQKYGILKHLLWGGGHF